MVKDIVFLAAPFSQGLTYSKVSALCFFELYRFREFQWGKQME